MRVSLSEIIRIVQPEISGLSKPQILISSLLTDSRKLYDADETLFFALKTKVRDGHQFIHELYKQGVRAFVVDLHYVYEKELYPEACFLHVPDPLHALRQIAAAHRKTFSVPVIGITGSNGKTIVKEWLYYILSHFSKAIRSPKSYNSQIGVPLSVILIEPFHEYAVFEAGISQPGEMSLLEEIIQPDFGIFTTIGPPHDENFTSAEQKVIEKLQLFRNSRKVVCSENHPIIIETALNNRLLAAEQFFIWGKGNNCNVIIEDIIKLHDKTVFRVQTASTSMGFEIPFTDDASVENAMHVFSALMMLGFEPGKVIPLMASLPKIAMRLELHNGINNCLLINDSYNSDIYSLSIALDFLKQQQQQRKSVVILSDILQSGTDTASLYSQTHSLLKNHNIRKLIGIGPEISKNQKIFSGIERTDFFHDTDDFLSDVKFSDFSNEIILLKGARHFAFERIASLLDQKSHQTVMEINLSAIQHNLNVYRSMLKPGTMIMAMVKAFSYGTGSHEIAGFLEYHGVHYLGVAYADEGVELRRKGIRMPVMVMAPEPTSMDSIITHNLEPEIYNFESLSWISAFSEDIVKIHLKFDTGMHRLGFGSDEIQLLCDTLKQMPRVRVMSLFSHLATADDTSDSDFTLKQLTVFNEMCSRFSSLCGYMPLRHILNSAGTENYTDAQFDMVRLGLGLYGIPSDEGNLLNLQQSIRLKTQIIQIKNIAKGDRIGYGTSCIAQSDMIIAVIPIGYADGFRRSLSNGKGVVHISGKQCNVVGNVCMDMSMIDVTHMRCQPGDEVIIFDEHYTVSEFAQAMGVIPYEAITGISQRVKRRYLTE